MTDHDPSLIAANQASDLGPVEDLPEFAWLIGEDVAATPGASVEQDLFVEAKRTKMSTDCFEEVSRGDMHRFSLLEPSQREHLRQEMAELTADPDVYEAIRYGLVIHDLLKSKRALGVMGLLDGFDHDEAYQLLMTSPEYADARDQLLPSLRRLSPRGQDLLSRAAHISSNYPQTLQGEAPAATLEDLHNEPDSVVRDIDIAIKQFDIFGALGHINPDVSLTATPGTYRAMQHLNQALRDPALTTPEARNNAFLDAEIRYFLGSAVLHDPSSLAKSRVIARLARHLRVDNAPSFGGLMYDFISQPAVTRSILQTELSRTNRPTLASYSPDLVRTVTKQHGGRFALAYFAHVLQEAHIADREAREAGAEGILSVQLDDVMRAMHRGEFDPTQSTIRFAYRGGMLVAEARRPSLESLDGLPEFSAEALQGKRVVVVGIGGGSDGVQAAMMGKLLGSKYDCETAAVVSVRTEKRQVAHAGRQIGTATRQITPETEAVGDWRFLEHIPLEGDEPSPMYILNSTNPKTIQHDMAALLEATYAEVVIGVDTGGDSLYRSLHPSFSAHLPTDITPDHDYAVLQSLADMAAERPDVTWLSAVVAPGVDSPDYAREVLDEIGAAQLPLDAADTALVRRQYAEWRMDGSGSEEGRYGKTPLAWQLALEGKLGVQPLKLPKANVLSSTNPWRAFAMITPAMAGVAVADLQRHFAAIRRG